MHEDPKEFEKLRKLLALKRHEVPPPGYFTSFSNKVINQLEADTLERVSLWQQVVSLFRTRPAISWSFSCAAVMTLFVATSGFENQSTSNQAQSLPSVGKSGGSAAAASLALSTNDNAPFGAMRVALEPNSGSPTNREPEVKSLFDAPFYRQVEPVVFSP